MAKKPAVRRASPYAIAPTAAKTSKNMKTAKNTKGTRNAKAAKVSKAAKRPVPNKSAGAASKSATPSAGRCRTSSGRQLVAHIIQTNEFMCAAIGGTPKAPPTSPTDKDPKDVLVKALKESFEHCGAALGGVTDTQTSEVIALGPQKLPRVFFMIGIVEDWGDHYSTQASYLRLNGLLPPSAQPTAAGRGRGGA